jgi:hypothetical protein
MNKSEEHLLLIVGGLFVLWLLLRPSPLAYSSTGIPYASTSGGLLGSLTNFFNGAGNLLRGIGGTPAAGTTTVASLGPDDLAPVTFA